MKGNWLSTLGLALRAGKLITGEEQVVKAIQSGQAKLVIVAADASDGTLKKMKDKTSFYKVPLKITSDRSALGQAIGKGERVSLAVMDQGFASSIRNRIENSVSDRQ